MENPLERAVYLHCNIARIQPFIDCNKRTARIVESIVMMNAGLIPVYSSKDSDLLNYRKGLVSFYESENYNSYTDFFLDRQLSRINALDCGTNCENQKPLITLRELCEKARFFRVGSNRPLYHTFFCSSMYRKIVFSEICPIVST